MISMQQLVDKSSLNARRIRSIMKNKVTNKLFSLTAFVLLGLFTQSGANALGYSTNQFENDLASSPVFEQVVGNKEFLYRKSEYVDNLQSNNIKTLADFHGELKALGSRYVPEPTLVPIGVGDIQIFVPTYPVPKRVGDTFVQRLLILEQLRSALGSTVKWAEVNNQTEEQLINQLYSNGKEFARQNNLRLGGATDLTIALHAPGISFSDMIWPERRTIQGEQVLVPVVYLTQATLDNYAVDEHITSPSNTNATLRRIHISDSASMHLRAEILTILEDLENSGSLNVSKNSREIAVEGVLDIYGGSITAEENLNISAKAIRIRPTVVMSDDRYGQSQIIGSLASVNAPNGAITLKAYRLEDDDPNETGNIYVEGAQIRGRTVTLRAEQGNIDIVAAQLRSVTDQVIPGGRYTRSEVDYVGSTISGDEAVNLIASGYINVRASDLVSDQGIINILAGQGIYIENEFGVVQEQMHQKLGRTERNMSQLQTFAIQANLKAGKGIILNTDTGPIRLKAVDIESQDGTSLNAKDGQIQLLMAVEQDQYNFSEVTTSLLTIKTETESWDRDTAVYNTVVGGVEVNATRGVIVEYGGKEEEGSEAQIEALAELPGMEWMKDLHKNSAQNCQNIHGDGWDDLTLEERQELTQQQACIDFGFVELMDKYEYSKSTNLSPGAMAIIAIAAAVVTGGSSLALVIPAGAAPATVATITAINAGMSTLVSQAAIGITNGALNGDSPYQVWKDLGSKENVRQLATSMVTAGAMSYADELMKFEDISAFTVGAEKTGDLNLLGQSAQVVTQATVRTGIGVLAQGGSLSDFEDLFVPSLLSSVSSKLGKNIASEIGGADLNDLSRYLAHAALGCGLGAIEAELSGSVSADSGCSSGAGGAVIGELTASIYSDIGWDPSDDSFQDWKDTGVGVSQLASAFVVMVAGGDATIAGMTGRNAAEYNALSLKEKAKYGIKGAQCLFAQDVVNCFSDLALEGALLSIQNDMALAQGLWVGVQAEADALTNIDEDLVALFKVIVAGDFKTIAAGLRDALVDMPQQLIDQADALVALTVTAEGPEEYRQIGETLAPLMVEAAIALASAGTGAAAKKAFEALAETASNVRRSGPRTENISQGEAEDFYQSVESAASPQRTRLRDKIANLSASERALIESVETFKTDGVSPDNALRFIQETPEGQLLFDTTLQAAGEGADLNKVLSRAAGYVETGVDVPLLKKITTPLVKIIPTGGELTKYSPFFTTQAQLDLARQSGRSLSDVFGLPAISDSITYGVFEITPLKSTSVFESVIAPTSELNGKLTTQGGGVQYVVPDRKQFSSPIFIEVIGDNL